jgi:coproporphyrinogen III oxidase
MGQAQLKGVGPTPNSAETRALEQQKQSARHWFEALQGRICAAFEQLEQEAPAARYQGTPGHFQMTAWSRAKGKDGADQGGGRMGMMRGRLFAKVGVHTSTVFGELPKDFAAQVKGGAGGRFWASGISLIAHFHNPRVPPVHMNCRFIVTAEHWFGGGADLNPTVDEQRRETHDDARDFHARQLVPALQSLGR